MDALRWRVIPQHLNICMNIIRGVIGSTIQLWPRPKTFGARHPPSVDRIVRVDLSFDCYIPKTWDSWNKCPVIGWNLSWAEISISLLHLHCFNGWKKYQKVPSDKLKPNLFWWFWWFWYIYHCTTSCTLEKEDNIFCQYGILGVPQVNYNNNSKCKKSPWQLYCLLCWGDYFLSTAWMGLVFRLTCALIFVKIRFRWAQKITYSWPWFSSHQYRFAVCFVPSSAIRSFKAAVNYMLVC